MAEEVGSAFVRLLPSMRGFGSEAQRALSDALAAPARRAGTQAGDLAANGFGAAMRRGATDVGRDAGRAAGSGIADGAEGPAAAAGGTTAGRFGAAFKAGLAGVAVAGAAVLFHGFTQALDESRIKARLAAQLGASGEDAERFGHIAGQLYADAVVASFQDGADAIRGVVAAGLLPPDATDRQIRQIATGVADLADVFEFDLGETAAAVGQLIKTGMAPDAKAGLDLLAAGLQGTDRRAQDALETITEYGGQFQLVGLDGADSMGLIRQALQAGARDTDQLADSLKEFHLRAVTDAKPVQDAFKALGLDAKEMGDDIGAGGDRARGALDKVLDELREMPASAERARIVQDLFGGPGENLGPALFALDVDKAATSLDGMSGAAEDLGNTLRDNAGTRVDQFKRRLEQGLVTFLGEEVIPAIERFGDAFGPTFRDIGQAASDFWTEVQPALSDLKALAGEVFAAFGEEIDGEGLFGGTTSISDFFAQASTIVTEGVGLIRTVWDSFGVHIMTAVGIVWDTIGGYISAAMTQIQGIIKVITSIIEGDWKGAWDGVWMIISGTWGKVTSLVGGALTLLASLIWSGLQIVGGLVSGAWGWVTQRTGEAWDWLKRKVRDAIGAAAWWVGQKVAAIKDKIEGIKTAIKRKLAGAKTWLVQAGKDIIQGLINGLWSKVRDLGSTMSSIADYATSWWPFSPAKRGPLRSKPPEMWGANVGKLAAAGLRSSIGDIAAASELAAGQAALPAAALAPTPRLATAPAGATVVVDGVNLPGPLLEWLRSAIRTEGGGDVQGYLGQGG